MASDDFNTGDMKVPTFYSSKHSDGKPSVSVIFLMSVAGVVFGGIHCAGWFFIFPSNFEAFNWRLCSVFLTCAPFLLPPSIYLLKVSFPVLIPIIGGDTVMLYVFARLFLLVEAFISLRHLTPGMLALVKWTSFIPHI